jgi:hypothetical protein
LLIRRQIHAVGLLSSGLQETSPERLAWTVWWVRVFAALDTARALLSRRSHLGFDLLDRSLFETSLQLQTALAPVLGRDADGAEGDLNAWPAVMERFRAFLAWILWSDRKVASELDSDDVMGAVWNPEPTRSLQNDPEVRHLHEALFGELQLFSEDELRIDQAKHRAKIRRDIKRLDEWLADPSLSLWHEKICALGRDTTYYQIFEKRQRSVRARLIAIGMGYAYVEYMRASGAVHGSSFDGVVALSASAATPLLIATDDHVARRVGHVEREVGHQLLLLSMVRGKLWPSSDRPVG